MRNIFGSIIRTCVCALLLVSYLWPATSAEAAPTRRLLLAGSPKLRLVLEELCKRTGSGELRERYGEILLIEDGSGLGELQSGLPPGAEQEATAGILNTMRAVENDFTVCPEGGSQRRRLEPPADLLFLRRDYESLDRVNIVLKLFSTEGQVGKTELLKNGTVVAVNMMEAREVQAAVGCVGWALWGVSAWLRPEARCSKWNLRDEPASAAPIDVKTAAAARVVPRLVPPVVAGTGVALGVAGYFVYAAGRSKRDAILEDGRSRRAYDPANENFATFGRWGIGMMVTGGIVVAAGVLLYLVDRGAGVERASSDPAVTASTSGQLSWRF